MLLVLAAIAGQSACIGWPSAADDSGLPPDQLGGYCTGFANTADVKAPHGVIVNARPGKDKLDGTILLDINILVPADVAVRLVSPEVILRSPQWPEPRRLRIDHLTGGDPSRFPPDLVIRGPRDHGRPPAVRTLWFSPETAREAPQTGIPQVPEFTLILPPLAINGESFRPEPIRFRAYTRMGLFRCIPQSR